MLVFGFSICVVLGANKTDCRGIAGSTRRASVSHDNRFIHRESDADISQAAEVGSKQTFV